MQPTFRPEYGRCPCGGTYEHRRVEVRMTVDSEQVSFEDVSQGACPICGARVYKPRTLALLEAVMRSGTERSSAGE